MSKRKLNPSSSADGEFKKASYAEEHPEETYVQTITISEAKYKEAEGMLEKLKSLREGMSSLPGILEGKFEVLNWLIADGEKPELKW